MLLSVPRDLWGAFPWALGLCLEVAVARVTWNLDHISDELHLATSSRWHVDPGATSLSCRAPVEAGKLAGFAFGWSVALQLGALAAIKVMERKQAAAAAARDAVRFGSYRGEASLAPLEGIPEVVYALHAVLALAVSGMVAGRGLHLLLFRRSRWRHCPHNRILGLFRFSVAANGALCLWYLVASGSAIRIVLVDALKQSAGGFGGFAGRGPQGARRAGPAEKRS